MRNGVITITCLLAILGSCKPEPETLLNTRIVNMTSVLVEIDDQKCYSSPLSSDKILLNPGEECNETNYHRGGTNNFPVRLFTFFVDTFVVCFADTLRIVHVGPWLSLDSTLFQGREEIILYDDPRNLYNLDSYEKGRLKDYSYEAKYTFTEEDLEYAISVYE